MKEFIEYVAKKLVDKPENVIVEETNPDENTKAFTLNTDKDDIGKVIGKHGRIADSIRTILTAASAKEKRRTILEILE